MSEQRTGRSAQVLRSLSLYLEAEAKGQHSVPPSNPHLFASAQEVFLQASPGWAEKASCPLSPSRGVHRDDKHTLPVLLQRLQIQTKFTQLDLREPGPVATWTSLVAASGHPSKAPPNRHICLSCRVHLKSAPKSGCSAKASPAPRLVSGPQAESAPCSGWPKELPFVSRQAGRQAGRISFKVAVVRGSGALGQDANATLEHCLHSSYVLLFCAMESGLRQASCLCLQRVHQPGFAMMATCWENSFPRRIALFLLVPQGGLEDSREKRQSSRSCFFCPQEHRVSHRLKLSAPSPCPGFALLTCKPDLWL